jgi:nucleoid-associated protein YgaU
MGYNRYYRLVDAEKGKTRAFPSVSIDKRASDLYIRYNQADRLDLMAANYYGTAEYWWVLLLANSIHIEFDIVPGQLIRIPWPIEETLEEIDRKLKV